MDAKKCDRCGSFFIRKELKTDNAVYIFGKKVFRVTLTSRDSVCDNIYDVDLCPKCMNDLKAFMEVQHVTPYVTEIKEE